MKILIAGDFAPCYRVQKFIEQNNSDNLFDKIRPFTQDADYSIVNLESPVVDSTGEKIQKTGPNLKCDKKAVYVIRKLGFDCVTLANNHFYDYGENGVKDTLNTCKENGIDCIGGGKNINEAKQILYKKICDKKFAFINFCENEWSIATTKNGGSAPLDIVDNYHTIIEAKSNADYVIVIIHGGHELYQLPTPKMQKTYRFFVEAGADVVVNHHQHCYSGYEQYNGKYIFYGLGNFCFDSLAKRNSIWNEGYFLKLDFFDNITFELIPYRQGNYDAGIIPMDSEGKMEFKKNIDKLNSIIRNKDLLEKAFNERCEESNYILSYLEPFNNKYLKALINRGLFPSLLSKNKKRLILALFRCETLREIMFRLLIK